MGYKKIILISTLLLTGVAFAAPVNDGVIYLGGQTLMHGQSWVLQSSALIDMNTYDLLCYIDNPNNLKNQVVLQVGLDECAPAEAYYLNGQKISSKKFKF